MAKRAPKCPMGIQDNSKNPTGKTPFCLTFGTEAIIPVEIWLTSFKTDRYDKESNNDQLCLNLDLLDKACDQAKAKIRAY